MSSRYSGCPDDLGESETLARLTIDEKKRIAFDAILEFPHLSNSMLDGWLRGHEIDVMYSASMRDKVGALVDGLGKQCRSGESKELLDHFIYGYLYPANLEHHGIDPDEVVGRQPLDEWEGVYDL